MKKIILFFLAVAISLFFLPTASLAGSKFKDWADDVKDNIKDRQEKRHERQESLQKNATNFVPHAVRGSEVNNQRTSHEVGYRSGNYGGKRDHCNGSCSGKVKFGQYYLEGDMYEGYYDPDLCVPQDDGVDDCY